MPVARGRGSDVEKVRRMFRDQGHAARRDADAFRYGLKGGLRLRNLSADAPPCRRRLVESGFIFIEFVLECRKRGAVDVDIYFA